MRSETAGIIGIGSYLPEKVLTNADLQKIIDSSDEWITTRTGIKQRHVAAQEEATSDLATQAALSALQDAETNPKQLDMILVATFTPDTMTPSTSSQVQKNIGAVNACALDINAACSGFIYGLAVAHQFVVSGAMKNVLVIGAETLSRYLDWDDRTTCVLFGDGAGAAVVSKTESGSGILNWHLGTDGTYPKENLILVGSGSISGQFAVPERKRNYLMLNGKAIFKFSVDILPDVITTIVRKSDLTLDEVNVIIPHQANRRIIESAAERLGLSMEKFYVNVDRRANTSAASIPIAMVDARNEGKLKKGDIVVLAGFGAGLTSGGIALRF
jgi:3-oxoacyl-[acyl-carrier-protein] synthase-3